MSIGNLREFPIQGRHFTGVFRNSGMQFVEFFFRFF